MLNLQEFKSKCEAEARSLLDYWLTLQDKKRGGFFSKADFQGVIATEEPKGVLLHARILWAFSRGYRALGDERYLEAARHCHEFLTGPAFDQEHGGVYWLLDAQGKIADSQKHIYNQGFVIYALSEYYLACGDESALTLALELFDLIEEHAFDSVFGGYREAFDVSWKPIENTLVCDTAEGVLAEKSMNTHLHIMEAYTKLQQARANRKVEQQLRGLIELLCDKVVNGSMHFGLFFKRDWQCVSHDVSFGHDIEGTWLIDKAALQCRDEAFRARVFQKTLTMAQVNAAQAIDKDGGVFNELREGHLIDCDRIWWVQAEALVGYLNAYQKEREQIFMDSAQRVFSVILAQLKDRDNGEWYWKVDRYGKPYPQCPKVEPWKCPYHNVRALLEASERLAALSET